MKFNSIIMDVVVTYEGKREGFKKITTLFPSLSFPVFLSVFGWEKSQLVYVSPPLLENYQPSNFQATHATYTLHNLHNIQQTLNKH